MRKIVLCFAIQARSVITRAEQEIVTIIQQPRSHSVQETEYSFCFRVDKRRGHADSRRRICVRPKLLSTARLDTVFRSCSISLQRHALEIVQTKPQALD